jgi:alpha-galactosidase
MYFKFDQAKLLKLARAGKALGMELFVLDDGWFKGRNDDTTSLGDWQADTKKLPGGLKTLAKKVRALGLDFGIWVEPEMVSPDSDLYRAHPDWAIKLPRRSPSLGRNQLILDLTNPEVTDYLFQEIDRVIRESGAAYVKWDMNRSVSDLHSPALGPEKQKEQSHRHYLGLYSLLKRLTGAHPEVLFESCASGGNRYDLGMLYYMPQTWASDNTDPGERAHIQYGSSLLYPPSTLGAHVGSNPSHQVLRSNGVESRFNIAAFGILGYELDLTKLSHFDAKVIRNQVDFYKEHRRLFQFGQMRRILSPFDTNHAVWLVTSEDRQTAVLCYFQKFQKSSGGFESIPLKGLDKNCLYEIVTRQQYMNIERFGALINDYVPFEVKTTGVGGLVHKTICDNYLFPNEVQRTVAPGDELAHAGFKLNPQFTGSDFNENIRFIGDFGSRIYLITAREHDKREAESPEA